MNRVAGRQEFYRPAATQLVAKAEGSMAREEFTIRITKKGEILIEVDGMPVRRVKDLVSYFEETLGPVTQVESDASGAPGQVELDDLLGREGEEELERVEERAEGDRIRVREE